MTTKIGVFNLGCAKNLVDAEKLMTYLQAEGYGFTQDFKEADLVIVNTCGFINDAIEESLNTIDYALSNHAKVIVTGCLGKNKALILEKHPKVLAVTGPDSLQETLEAVHRILPPVKKHSCQEDLTLSGGVKLTPSHYAYLKIAEGCDHPCTFCIIPQIRGALKSRPLEAIIKEASSLRDQGVKELLVIAQDTSTYGLDLKNNRSIVDLAEALSDLGMWIRLHYLYPHPHLDALVKLMSQGKILPYLDVPLQHAHPEILKRMKRPNFTINMLDKINQWRDLCPEIAIRSTFIVGFPGETDAHFEHLLDFLEQAKLDRVGAFQYSPVKGAAANAFADQIAPAIKAKRLDQLMALQMEISEEKLAQKIGQTLPVIIDEITQDETLGRSYADSPEVDGLVIIENAPLLTPGDIVQVTITDAQEHDLIGMVNRP